MQNFSGNVFVKLLANLKSAENIIGITNFKWTFTVNKSVLSY